MGATLSIKTDKKKTKKEESKDTEPSTRSGAVSSPVLTEKNAGKTCAALLNCTPKSEPSMDADGYVGEMIGFFLRGRTLTIVFADDDELMHRIYERYMIRLEKAHGCTINIVRCDDGQQLVKYVLDDRGEFDFIFTDNQMPNMTGSDAIAKLAAKVPGITSRIALVSADTDLSIYNPHLDHPRISKPINFAAVQRAMMSIDRRHSI